jgi:hypothetical protein
MELETCPICLKPYLATAERCPHCPPEYEWNQESWANIGCFALMILLALLMVLLPLILIGGFFIRF